LKQPLPLLAGRKPCASPVTTTSETASPDTTTFKAACGCENIFTKFGKILDICKRM
jgi:hypothetical protein